MNDPQNKPGGISEVILWLGKTVGVAAALFATPAAFAASKAAIYGYFAAFVGPGSLALALTWLIGALEAALIFGAVTVFVALVTSWLATILVARGFR